MPSLATTRKKSSGILRYIFGAAPVNARGFNAQFAALAGGGASAEIVVLGADAEVTPDADDQVFGASCGHPAVGPIAGTLFVGAGLVNQPTDLVGPGNGGLNANGRLSAPGYIPAGTKFHAYFVNFASAAVASVAVTWDVIQNRPFRGVTPTAVEDLLPVGSGVGPFPGQFLGAIRVAIFNQGAQLLSGALICRLEHSIEDIPGDAAQSGINLTA